MKDKTKWDFLSVSCKIIIYWPFLFSSYVRKYRQYLVFVPESFSFIHLYLFSSVNNYQITQDLFQISNWVSFLPPSLWSSSPELHCSSGRRPITLLWLVPMLSKTPSFTTRYSNPFIRPFFDVCSNLRLVSKIWTTRPVVLGTTWGFTLSLYSFHQILISLTQGRFNPSLTFGVIFFPTKSFRTEGDSNCPS